MKDIVELNNLYLNGLNERQALFQISKKNHDPIKFKYHINNKATIIKICNLPKIKKQINFEYKSSFWKEYRKKVWEETNKQDLKSLKNYELRGFKNYHLDHKISIFYGFKNNIDYKIIGNISNLKMIPYKENMIKGIKCNYKNV